MHFRLAHHTADLAPIRRFYTQILGLNVLGTFENHDGYDGLFLGKKGLDWHLEFTCTKEAVHRTMDEDDAMVFYPENQEELNQILSRLEQASIPLEHPKNPYWISNGHLFRDPDGNAILLSLTKFEP